MADILNGKPVAEKIKHELRDRIFHLKAKGIAPKLGIVRVGKRSDDLYYEKAIKKTCDDIELDDETVTHDETISQESIENSIKEMADNTAIHGVLFFSPLPKHLDEKKIRSLIPVNKDIDGMNILSLAELFSGNTLAFPPCTPAACIALLNYYNIPIEEKHCVILGRSLVIGKPLAILMLRENATVTICHSKTKDLEKLCKTADILITAIGHAKTIGADFVSEKQIILDVGINQDPNCPSQYCGDVDFVRVEPIVEKISPVPFGIGSVTTSILCQHTVTACERISQSHPPEF